MHQTNKKQEHENEITSRDLFQKYDDVSVLPDRSAEEYRDKRDDDECHDVT